MFKGRVILLACLLAFLLALTLGVRSGILRRWAIGTLDLAASDPLPLPEELENVPEADTIIYSFILLPSKGSEVIQVETVIHRDSADAANDGSPEVESWLRVWNARGNTTLERHLAKGAGPISYDGAGLKLSQGGIFTLGISLPASYRQSNPQPLIEASWVEKENGIVLYARLHPEAAVQTHRVIGGESAVFFGGRSSGLLNLRGVEENESGTGFLVRRSASRDPYAAASFSGYVEQQEWVVFPDGSGAFWLQISDDAGKPVILRGGASVDGNALASSQISFLSGRPGPKQLFENDESGTVSRHVRIRSRRGEVEYLAMNHGRLTRFEDGGVGYTFFCDGSYGERPEERWSGPCRGAGRVLRRQ